MMRSPLIFALLALYLSAVAHTQEVPPIACPNYFQYLSDGIQYYGKVTLPGVSMGTITLNVSFSQRTPALNNFYGKLSLYADQDTTIRQLKSGQPITYRVDFPVSNVLPKLTRILYNDDVICSDRGYPPPVTMFSLHHILHLSTIGPLSNGFQGQPPTFDFSNTPAGPYNDDGSFQTPFFQPQAQPPRDIPQPPRFFVPQQQQPQQPQQSQQPAALPNNQAACGREGGDGFSPFIHGGTVLSRGQFPWLTAIYKKQQSEGLLFICGGSLISTRTVLTAAHCFKVSSLTAERVVVYLGRHNLESYEDGMVARDIHTLLINPEYDPEVYPDADLAILQMKSPVSYTEYIRPICLWSESTEVRLVVGQKGYVAGWGADENGRAVSELPKMVDADIVSESVCLRSQPAFRDVTSPRTLCAGNRDDTGPCMGDSGGGLMMNRNGRWVLRGIVSAGQVKARACNLREFVVYCDLAQHLPWVRSNLL